MDSFDGWLSIIPTPPKGNHEYTRDRGMGTATQIGMAKQGNHPIIKGNKIRIYTRRNPPAHYLKVDK